MKNTLQLEKHIQSLLKERNQGVKIDLGCGGIKLSDDWIGVDIRPMKGVDVVWDLERFPYPFPDECASMIVTSHTLEHINPHSGDSRVAPLIKLLLDKKVLTEAEVKDYIGEIDPGPRFFRLMNEVWRIMKYDGEFIIALPYGGSFGFWQDPTHINGVNEATWAYFDPLEPTIGNGLYRIYKPKPWKIKDSYWAQNGNMEVVLVKRREDKSYYE